MKNSSTGKAIRYLRSISLTSASRMANDMHVSPSHISDLESERKGLTAEKTEKVCNYFGITVSQFYTIAEALAKKGFEKRLQNKLLHTIMEEAGKGDHS